MLLLLKPFRSRYRKWTNPPESPYKSKAGACGRFGDAVTRALPDTLRCKGWNRTGVEILQIVGFFVAISAALKQLKAYTLKV